MFIGKFNNTVFKTTPRFYSVGFYKRISHSNCIFSNNGLANDIAYSYYSTKLSVGKGSDVIEKSEESSLTFDESGVIKCTKDQWLYKPTAKEIDLFLSSKVIPSRPFDLEKSVAVNLVDLNKDLASPVKRAVYFSEYGIRKGEAITLFVIWLLFTSAATYLGYWQLQRKKWKESLLETIKNSLSLPRITINSLADIKAREPPVAGSNDLVYRVIEAHGVLDTQHQFLVGPRMSMMSQHGQQSGYYVLYPLRFKDGSSILINMGWLKGDDVFNMVVTPEWVTVRGVLVKGEISEKVIQSLKFKVLSMLERIVHGLTKSEVNLTRVVNSPSSIVRDEKKMVYRYLDPDSMATQILSTEPSVTRRYLLNVYDSYFDEDKPEPHIADQSSSNTLIKRVIKMAGISKYGSPPESTKSVLPRYDFQRKQKSDYLLFYADPGTHFNYAMQWFLMGISITCMCIYKVFRVLRVLKNFNR